VRIEAGEIGAEDVEGYDPDNPIISTAKAAAALTDELVADFGGYCLEAANVLAEMLRGARTALADARSREKPTPARARFEAEMLEAITIYEAAYWRAKGRKR
jgi:hypothetical protein